MGNSIVLELQRMATEPNVDVASMLRKALVIATKLKQEDFRKWIDSELNGYRADVPEYRVCRCVLKAVNPYLGLIPVVIPDERVFDALTLAKLRDPLPHLLGVAAGAGEKRGITLPLSHSQQEFLRSRDSEGLGFDTVRVLPDSVVTRIVEAVRNAMLEWTLKLEQAGILGEGMTFTKAEQERALATPNINIGNFQGILGNVTQSTVTQTLTQKVTAGDFESLKACLQGHGIQGDAFKELKRAIQTNVPATQADKFGPCVGAWVGKMVGLAAKGTWDVGVGAAGNIVAGALNGYYGLA